MLAVSEFQTAGAEQRKAWLAKLIDSSNHQTSSRGFCPSTSLSSTFYFLLEQTRMIVLISALLSSARSSRHVSDNWPSCWLHVELGPRDENLFGIVGTVLYNQMSFLWPNKHRQSTKGTEYADTHQRKPCVVPGAVSE